MLRLILSIIYLLKDKLVLLFYRLFSFAPISKNIRNNHLEHNSNAWDSYKTRYSADKYIEHQSALSELSYGRKYTADYNSCEVIAVYNALIALGNKYDFPLLLESFEKKGISFFGAFGTSPYAMIKYLKTLGYSIELCNYKRWRNMCSDDAYTKDSYEKFSNRNETFIYMSYNNDRSLRDMIHTMCITKDGNYFQTHNDYEGSKCYQSLKEAVNEYKNGKSRMILLIGIRKRRNKNETI